MSTTPVAATSTPATEGTKTDSETSEKIDEDVVEVRGTNKFVFALFVIAILAAVGFAFVKFDGVNRIRTIVRRGGPRYHRVDHDLEK